MARYDRRAWPVRISLIATVHELKEMLPPSVSTGAPVQ